MNSPDPITLVSMIGGLPSAWRARAFVIPIALAGWRSAVSLRWAVYGLAGFLAVGRSSGAHAEDVVQPAVDAADAANGGPKPLWEAGIGGIAGAVADYPGSNQYRVRGLPLPFFIYRATFSGQT